MSSCLDEVVGGVHDLADDEAVWIFKLSREQNSDEQQGFVSVDYKCEELHEEQRTRRL